MSTMATGTIPPISVKHPWLRILGALPNVMRGWIETDVR